ncbi:hypothetical protein [Actinacidiphila alni]|uniref:hypothetical protein n=1 Tax=Actinacidiphila alni TaxID=380248 RepID=UPI003452A921
MTDNTRGALRFLAELIAWVATPWALWPHSPALAIGAVLLLVGLPTLFSTPGDRPGGDSPFPVPGAITILLLLLQLTAATASSWTLLPTWPAAAITALCLTIPITDHPRWHRLLTTPRPTAANATAHGWTKR